MTHFSPVHAFMRPIRQWVGLSAVVLLTFALSMVSGTPADAKTMQAPGSRISMDLPDNFKASPLFAGFMEVISSAAVITLELPPEAYDKVVAGFTAEALAKKGIVDVKVGKLDRADTHVYVTGEQKHPRAVFRKFILVMRDAKNTAVLTFNVPQGSLINASIKQADVIKALTSAKLEAKAAPTNDLFKLGYLGPFELTGKPTGTSRIYVTKGDTGPKETRNVMAISPSLNRLPVRDVKDFAQYALKSLNKNKDLTVTATKDVEIDGMSGHQIVASAKRGAANTPVVVRQLVLLPPKGGYYRLVTINKAADEARLAPEIEKVFASFKATKNALAQ